ncbi:hypothetical protein [Actinomadura nitritigenes]|uniref:Uncharacterized protein n=1 Tax=Actinomadura nitritigenes TaxID=134602 RepID=A0ABS3QWT0_9ACTN|nr:hypothetical protein [Actinomadura nitritigenes]MBO2438260.1 hypothetical protein [Actinomadura nitritigenes]
MAVRGSRGAGTARAGVSAVARIYGTGGVPGAQDVRPVPLQALQVRGAMPVTILPVPLVMVPPTSIIVG